MCVEATFSICQQKRQKRFNQERDEAVALLQATFKGHLARRQVLRKGFLLSPEEWNEGVISATEEPQRDEIEGEGQAIEGEEEEAIQTVQAAFRGHLARKAYLTG